MSALGRELARVVRVDWDPARIRVAEAGLHARRRRRAIVRSGAAASLAVMVGVVALLRTSEHAGPELVARQPATLPTPAQSAATAVHETAPPVVGFELADRSRVTPTSDATRVRVVSDEPGGAVIELAAGEARFDVAATKARSFRVDAGRVQVTTFAAKFGAARYEHAVRVEVWEGTVHVAAGDEEHDLSAGEIRTFALAAVTTNQGPRHPAAHRRAAAAVVADASWHELARSGEFDKAYAVLAKPDAPAVRDVPDELLLAADVRRLSHHPAEAVAPLRQIVRDHASDPRAPLAAFTLGRVLLDELDRPGDAAAAFAQAFALAPEGGLAEDALARRVEALSRAGETTTAHEAAEQYVSRFPGGRKLGSVRHYGGI